MNKGILCLILFGVALSMLHIPNVILPLGIIAGLIMLAVKLSWRILQGFEDKPIHTV